MKIAFLMPFHLLVYATALAPAQTPLDSDLDKLIGAAYSCGFADGMQRAINEFKGTNKPYGPESCYLARQAAKNSGFDFPSSP
jgi:hypothetical protein